MKKIYSSIILAFTLGIVIVSCNKSDPPVAPVIPPVLVGNDGNPRFNLQFTNPENVDLDLYVKTPSGAIISYSNPTAESGILDVDCLCGVCAQGPNENIYWVPGTAPTGVYEYWVNYYGSCTTAGTASTFTLRVIRNGVVLDTKTGSLNADGDSTHWTFQQ